MQSIPLNSQFNNNNSLLLYICINMAFRGALEFGWLLRPCSQHRIPYPYMTLYMYCVLCLCTLHYYMFVEQRRTRMAMNINFPMQMIARELRTIINCGPVLIQWIARKCPPISCSILPPLAMVIFHRMAWMHSVEYTHTHTSPDRTNVMHRMHHTTRRGVSGLLSNKHHRQKLFEKFVIKS